MSRAVNIDATQDEVVAVAAQHGAAISAIEAIHPSGTRVVFMNIGGAAAVTKAFGLRVLTGPVTRQRFAQGQSR